MKHPIHRPRRQLNAFSLLLRAEKRQFRARKAAKTLLRAEKWHFRAAGTTRTGCARPREIAEEYFNKGIELVAKRLKAEGIPVETISSATGLSCDVIKSMV